MSPLVFMSNNNAKYLVDSAPITKEAFLNRDCTRHAFDPLYTPPTTVEINALLNFAGWSQAEVAKLTDVSFSHKGSTAVRNWRKGERNMTYSTWRLLLVYAGIVEEEEISHKDHRLANI